MRRIKMVCAALVVMVAAFAAFASPAMAQTIDGYSCGYYNYWGYYNDCGYYYPQSSGLTQAPSETYVAGSNVNNAGSVTT